MTEQKFITVRDAGEAYESTKRGKEFRARVISFAGKDATIRPVGQTGRYVVNTFINLNNSAEIINSKLGTDFIGDPQYNSLAANFDCFVETQAEAEALAKKLVKGAKVSGSVVIGTHTYEDKLFLDVRLDSLFVEAPKARASAPLNKRVSDAVLDDSDLL